MNKAIESALVSVYNKAGLEPVVRKLLELDVKIYSTGGTQVFIEQLGIPCTSVESVTGYPSILGGRVKTLHPKIFGGILARRSYDSDRTHVLAYDIPLFDLVIVDLYPFEQTVKETTDEKSIIEKIDIGGVSLIRAAGKNFEDVCVIASKNEYGNLLALLEQKNGEISIDERKHFAALAFAECAHYDIAIANYFNKSVDNAYFQVSYPGRQVLRYGENPQQKASIYGNPQILFDKLAGKDLSYNNLVDVDAALKLIAEFSEPAFAIIKHTNVCGVAIDTNVLEAWKSALSCDPESAFGGVLVTNQAITKEVAKNINELFFEILIAPKFNDDALSILTSKKNRILLLQKQMLSDTIEFKSLLGCVLVQDADSNINTEWQEVGSRTSTEAEKSDLLFANIICKHLKSNAIAIVKNKKLIGKGCGQTSRVDALRQAIDKAKQSGFILEGAVLASDAFFPFDDCVRMANEAGIKAVIHPGGSIRDKDSIKYCQEHNMVMVITQTRHFKH